MPLYLEDVDFIGEIEESNSVLIVPCRTCPSTSVAVRDKKPIFDIFKSFLKSPPLTQYLSAMQNLLEEKGIKTDVFLSRQPLACAWTARERRRLQHRAQKFDTAIVLGCDSTMETARNALKDTNCKVVQGMRVKGIVNVKVRFTLSGKVYLDDIKIISAPGKAADQSGARNSEIA